MNAKAAAYIAKYSIEMEVDGQPQLALPLERVQGFFDLLQPSDVPPEALQRLYAAQATGVAQMSSQFRKAGWLDPATPPESAEE